MVDVEAIATGSGPSAAVAIANAPLAMATHAPQWVQRPGSITVRCNRAPDVVVANGLVPWKTSGFSPGYSSSFQKKGKRRLINSASRPTPAI